MGSRVDLHNELLKFMPNVYFQPPSNIEMQYPCIVYDKLAPVDLYADNELYLSFQPYQITLAEHNPDSTIAKEIVRHFQNCRITNHFVLDNLNQTTLNLHF